MHTCPMQEKTITKSESNRIQSMTDGLELGRSDQQTGWGNAAQKKKGVAFRGSHQEAGELTGVEALGEGGGVAEEAAADPAADARRDDRAAHQSLRGRARAAASSAQPRRGAARRRGWRQESGAAGARARAGRRRSRGSPSSRYHGRWGTPDVACGYKGVLLTSIYGFLSQTTKK